MRQLNGWIPSGAYLPILIITAGLAHRKTKSA
jgi:hypothetical protein